MDESRVDEIFEFIEDANIDLDPDPIRRGPKYLNKMVAECRNLMNQVQKYEREAAQERLMLEHKLNRLESEYEMKYNDLMSNNAEVIRQPSAKDREAKVNDMLKDLRSKIQEVESKITDLSHVETIIESKMKELKNVNRDLRLQKRLIEDEIQTGNFWGDQAESSEQIDNEDIDLEEEVLPEEQQDEEVKPEDYDELFGTSEEAGEDSTESNGEVDPEEALEYIDPEPSSDEDLPSDDEEEVFDDSEDEEDQDPDYYDDLLSDL